MTIKHTLLALAALLSTPALAEDRGEKREKEEQEEKLTDTKLPPAVQAAVDRTFPGATILEVERERGRYEVELRAADGSRHELKVSEDGGDVGQEVEEEDDED